MDQAKFAVSINFEVPECELEYGQGLKVVGSGEALGDWQGGLDLTWHDGHNWKGSIECPKGCNLEFKLVKAAGDSNVWEEGPNRVIEIPASATKGSAHIICKFGNPTETVVQLQTEETTAEAAATDVGRKEEPDMSWIDIPASFAESVAAVPPPALETVATDQEEEEEDHQGYIADEAIAASNEVAIPVELSDCIDALSSSGGGEVVTFSFKDSEVNAAELAAKLLKIED